MIALVFLAGVAGAQVHVLGFDDLGGLTGVPNGYGGLDWTNFGRLNGTTFPFTSGYPFGAVSPDYVAFVGGGGQSVVQATSGPFDFSGAYLTAAWNDGLDVEVQGYRGGVLEYDVTVHPSPTAATWFPFDFRNVDEIVFASSGGTPHPGYAGGGTQVALDDFTITPVPEPSTLMSLGIGLPGLVALVRKRVARSRPAWSHDRPRPSRQGLLDFQRTPTVRSAANRPQHPRHGRRLA